MIALIFYPADKSDHIFSVYVNRPGLSFGYFFRGGGDIANVETHIAEFTVEDFSERAFVSMNQQQVVKMEIDDGNTLQTTAIDPNTPFSFVLPTNIGNITFIDINGNTVETIQSSL